MSNTIDPKKFQQMCRKALRQNLMPVAEKYQHVFAHEYDMAHPSRKRVGNSVQTYIQVIPDMVQENGGKVIIPIGLRQFAPDYIRSRIHVIEEGTGEIWSNPGQQVYDDEWRTKHKSNAEQRVEYPELQHDAQHILDNIYTIARSKSNEWEKEISVNTSIYIAQHIKDCLER